MYRKRNKEWGEHPSDKREQKRNKAVKKTLVWGQYRIRGCIYICMLFEANIKEDRIVANLRNINYLWFVWKL
jgi:hypothetical protein